jgi:hypothetical protein
MKDNNEKAQETEMINVEPEELEDRIAPLAAHLLR